MWKTFEQVHDHLQSKGYSQDGALDHQLKLAKYKHPSNPHLHVSFVNTKKGMFVNNIEEWKTGKQYQMNESLNSLIQEAVYQDFQTRLKAALDAYKSHVEKTGIDAPPVLTGAVKPNDAVNKLSGSVLGKKPRNPHWDEVKKVSDYEASLRKK